MVRDRHPLLPEEDGSAAAAARDRPRHHRRTPRRPAGRGEGRTAGSGGPGPGRPVGDAPVRSAGGPGPRSRPAWSAWRPRSSLPGWARLDGRRARVRVPPRAGLRGRLRPDPAPGAGRQAPLGCRLAEPAVERSELLAHHYGRALELASAAGQAPGELAGRARLALRDAGDRVSGLGVHITAARYYTQALAIWPADDAERPDLELGAGEASCLGEGTGEDLLKGQGRAADDGRSGQGGRGRGLGWASSPTPRGRSAPPTAVRPRPWSPTRRCPTARVVLSHGMMHLLWPTGTPGPSRWPARARARSLK